MGLGVGLGFNEGLGLSFMQISFWVLGVQWLLVGVLKTALFTICNIVY